MSRPPRHQECTPCRARGHRCEALIFSADEQGVDVPMCNDCAFGEICVFDRVHQVRQQVPINAFGEEIEETKLAPVISRTPASLGMAATVPWKPPVQENVPYSVGAMILRPKPEPIRLPPPDDEFDELANLTFEPEPETKMPVDETQVPAPETKPQPVTPKEKPMPKSTNPPCAEPGCKYPAGEGLTYCNYRHRYRDPKMKQQRVDAKAAKLATKPAKAPRMRVVSILENPPLVVACDIEVPLEPLTEMRILRAEKPSFASLGLTLGSMVQRKNNAYGNSFSTSGPALKLLYPSGIAPAQMDSALAIARVWDKLSRVATANDPAGESPWLDIAGYALLMLSQQETSSCASANDSDAATKSKTPIAFAAGNVAASTTTTNATNSAKT